MPVYDARRVRETVTVFFLEAQVVCIIGPLEMSIVTPIILVEFRYDAPKISTPDGDGSLLETASARL